eukprot:gene18641-57225_t
MAASANPRPAMAAEARVSFDLLLLESREPLVRISVTRTPHTDVHTDGAGAIVSAPLAHASVPLRGSSEGEFSLTEEDVASAAAWLHGELSASGARDVGIDFPERLLGISGFPSTGDMVRRDIDAIIAVVDALRRVPGTVLHLRLEQDGVERENTLDGARHDVDMLFTAVAGMSRAARRGGTADQWGHEVSIEVHCTGWITARTERLLYRGSTAGAITADSAAQIALEAAGAGVAISFHGVAGVKRRLVDL